LEENEFWLRIWKLILIGFAVAIATIASCTQASDYQARKMMEAGLAAGKSPLEIKCAWSGSDNNGNSCLLLYAK
jgi:hypothetical protein